MLNTKRSGGFFLVYAVAQEFFFEAILFTES